VSGHLSTESTTFFTLIVNPQAENNTMVLLPPERTIKQRVPALFQREGRETPRLADIEYPRSCRIWGHMGLYDRELACVSECDRMRLHCYVVVAIDRVRMRLSDACGRKGHGSPTAYHSILLEYWSPRSHERGLAFAIFDHNFQEDNLENTFTFCYLY